MRSTFYLTEKLGPKQSLTPEGFLLCADVPLARTGMMVYGPDETPIKAGPEGIVKIMREAEDVFTAETIASAQGKPVTNDHPDEDVTPENWKELCHGTMLNVRRGEGMLDDLILGDLLITTVDGIEAVRAGKVEVSLGYEADYEETGPGMGKQVNIIINHIALVDQGRCGPRCAIADTKPTLLRSETMKKPGNKILDALMKAFKAKDAAEVEKLAEEVKDAEEAEAKKVEDTEGAGSGETHIHIHNGTVSGEVPTGDEEVKAKAKEDDTKVNDDGELAAHIEQNASEHADMAARITALEELVATLQGGEAAPTGDAEGEELPKEALDEFPEDLKENASKAKDSAYFATPFQDAVALAEILVPGIRVPTFDREQKPGTTFKKVCGLRRQALDLAYAQPATRGIVDDILNGKELDTKAMTCDAVRTLFNAAAAAKRTANNQSGTRITADTKQVKRAPSSLAELNRINAAKYGNQ